MAETNQRDVAVLTYDDMEIYALQEHIDLLTKTQVFWVMELNINRGDD